MKQFRAMFAFVQRLLAFVAADETKIFTFGFADTNVTIPIVRRNEGHRRIEAVGVRPVIAAVAQQ